MNLERLLVIYLFMEYLFMVFNIVNIIGGTAMVSYDLYTQTNTSMVNCGDIHFLSFLGIINSVIVCFMIYRYIELKIIGVTSNMLFCVYNYYNLNTISKGCIAYYTGMNFVFEYYVFSVFTQTITLAAVSSIFIITFRCPSRFKIYNEIEKEPIYDN